MREVTTATHHQPVRAAARDILQSVTDDDVSKRRLPVLAARRIEVGDAHALAVRVAMRRNRRELYVARNMPPMSYETLRERAPRSASPMPATAHRRCRMEKGYLYWFGDISPDYNPYEAGLGFAVALDKPGGDSSPRGLAKIKAEG